MTILILEDELPAAQYLKTLIEATDTDFQVLTSIASNKEFMKWKSNNEWPDLIFSDIELLDGPVFNSFNKLTPESPIIFTTAYDHYMPEAFETSGISYLLKPYNANDVENALAKFKRLGSPKVNDNITLILSKLANLDDNKTYKTRFTIKRPNGLILLEVNRMACLVMNNGILNVIDDKGKAHIMSYGLSQIMEELDPSKFIQINRGEAVALDYINKVEHYGKDRLAIYLKGLEKPLITSASKTPSFRKWLEN